jgi:sugar porter (SP) family MFS transporter
MQKSSSKLLYWAITCALAGFIFGFDLIVISGAEQKIQSLWGLNGLEHGFAMSAALWGTVVGSIFGGGPTDKFGRKKVLLWIGILYFISAIGSAFAPNVSIFAISRLIGGIGIGVSTVAAPLFISEISPAERRGRLTGMFQFNIVFGLLIATISNAIILKMMGSESETAWRWMLGIEAIPALIYSFMCSTLPESPRWLINNSKRKEGKRILGQINSEFSEAELERKVVEIEQANSLESGKPRIFSKPLKLALALAFLIAFFNQLSGINAILGYAPRILGMTGFDPGESLVNASLITLVNLIFTLVGLRLIDKLGRRSLLYIGSFGYIVSLTVCAWAFHSYRAPFSDAADAIALKNSASSIVADISQLPEKYTSRVTSENLSEPWVKEVASDSLKSAKEEAGFGSNLVLICILAFIAAHAIGQGAVIWVFISEIFPTAARGFGQSVGCATHWIFAAILTLIFPLAMEAFSATQIFGFFTFMMILQLVWVRLMVPETKGVSLEDMQANLSKE